MIKYFFCDETQLLPKIITLTKDNIVKEHKRLQHHYRKPLAVGGFVYRNSTMVNGKGAKIDIESN